MQSLDYKQDRKRIKLHHCDDDYNCIIHDKDVKTMVVKVKWSRVIKNNWEALTKIYWGSGEYHSLDGLNRLIEINYDSYPIEHVPFTREQIDHKMGVFRPRLSQTITFRPGTMFNEKIHMYLIGNKLLIEYAKNKKEALEAVWFLNRYFFQFREYNLLLLSTKNLNTDICKTIKLFLI